MAVVAKVDLGSAKDSLRPAQCSLRAKIRSKEKQAESEPLKEPRDTRIMIESMEEFSRPSEGRNAAYERNKAQYLRCTIGIRLNLLNEREL